MNKFQTRTLSHRLCLAIIALSASLSFSQTAVREKQLNELADAERAFAAFTVKEGFRDGFIKFFADDGIGFGPHPERTREKLMKTPPATGPRKVIFNWAPVFGDISAAADLGYTTGPVLYSDLGENPRPPRHGIYFSVWQKQTDGSWKVAIDMGVDTPGAVAPIETGFTAAKLVDRGRGHAFSPTNAEDLRSLDDSFSKYIAKNGMAKGYANWLDRGGFRVHRKGQMPIVDEADLVPVVISGDSFEFIGGKASISNDLAFTYGKFTSARGGSDLETGYYVHVWRRDGGGKWKLVVDVQNPLPKEKK